MKSVKRTHLEEKIINSINNFKITALIGPRQVGKTTLSKQIAKLKKFKEIHFYDLEDPVDFNLFENAKLVLDNLEGLIVIDEIQRRPELFPYLRVKADKMQKGSKILILGSSSRNLIEKASESLAGRIQYIEVSGFTVDEIGENYFEKLFLKGGFPLSFLAKSDQMSYEWRKSYVQSYIERDIRGLGIDLPGQTFRRMLEMLAGYHGQILNLSEIGKSLGFSHTTARKYLDILISSFLIRELKPWHSQIVQRQVKQSKIYFRDSGLLNYLLGIRSKNEIQRYPRLGSLWEGFALEETTKAIRAESEDLYFWALHQQGEIDLLWKKTNQIIGFEFKYSDHPQISKSLLKAIELLKLDHVYLIYPGEKKGKLSEKVTLVNLHQMNSLKLFK